MRRRLSLAIVAALALAAVPLLAASLEEAWTYYFQGDLAAAEEAAAPWLEAEAAADRAAALSLLGTVAAARGELDEARQRWSEAAERYAETAAGREAAAKVDLLCALGSCPEAEGAAPAAATIVLVAGQGEPFEAVRDATALLGDFLRSRGVAAESPTEDIAVVQRSEVVVGQLLNVAEERGAASVLVLDAQFGYRERVQATCWSPDGTALWTESVTGGTGLVRPVRMNRNLMERLHEKLTARLGGPGLPLR